MQANVFRRKGVGPTDKTRLFLHGLGRDFRGAGNHSAKAAGRHPSWALQAGRARRAHLGGSPVAFAKRFPAHGSPPDAAKKKRYRSGGPTALSLFGRVRQHVGTRKTCGRRCVIVSTSTFDLNLLCTCVGKGKSKTKGKSDSGKGKGSTEVQGIFRML